MIVMAVEPSTRKRGGGFPRGWSEQWTRVSQRQSIFFSFILSSNHRILQDLVLVCTTEELQRGHSFADTGMTAVVVATGHAVSFNCAIPSLAAVRRVVDSDLNPSHHYGARMYGLHSEGIHLKPHKLPWKQTDAAQPDTQRPH